MLYRKGQSDPTVYFVIFGKIKLLSGASSSSGVLGCVTLGWTLGEELLFDSRMQVRPEHAVCTKAACLVGITKDKLNALQEAFLRGDLKKDYFALESALKGNYIIKQKWRHH